MARLYLSAREQDFVIPQRDLFLSEAFRIFGVPGLHSLPPVTSRKPIPLHPILVKDFRELSELEIGALRNEFWGERGVAYFIVENFDAIGTYAHPLTEMAAQLSGVLPLKYPVDHPMEGHSEAVRRFGPPDGTLKIYDLETRDGVASYREQAETAEMFDAHNDGLGYAGAVQSVILYTDRAPVWGGFTYFSNVVRLALDLAASDLEAFTSLFLPDAISALRPRGKGAIKVTAPVLFVNEHSRPQCFLRVATGEYRISWRSDCEPLARAAAFLNSHVEPFAPGSAFVHLDRRGAGVIVQNEMNVHGRTPFLDARQRGECRVLARKWFMSDARHAHYKHVPGIHIHQRYAAVYPELFGPERLEGDWNFDPTAGVNVRRD